MAEQGQYGQRIVGGWFDDRPDSKNGKEKHCYRDEKGNVVPSVTQILAMLSFNDFTMVKKEVVERKRQIGSAVHLAAEFLDKPGAGELDWESVHELCVPYVLSYEQTVETMKLKADKAEHAVVSTIYGMPFGCRLDRTGTWGDPAKKCIWEIKTSATKSPSWALQTAAQALTLFPEAKDAEKEKLAAGYHRFALQLQKDGSVAKIDEHGNPRDFRLFISALSLVHYKLANRYKLPEIPDMVVEEDDE